MTPKSFDEWWNNYDDPHGHGRLHHDAAQIGWNASRAVLLADHDVAGLVENGRGFISRSRESSRSPFGVLLSFGVAEFEAYLYALESLAAQVAERDAEIARLKAHADAMSNMIRGFIFKTVERETLADSAAAYRKWEEDYCHRHGRAAYPKEPE